MDIDEAITCMAEQVMFTLFDDADALIKLRADASKAQNVLHEYSLKEAGLTQERLDDLGEKASAEYEHPRYSLYWATRSALNTAILAKATTGLRHFAKPDKVIDINKPSDD